MSAAFELGDEIIEYFFHGKIKIIHAFIVRLEEGFDEVKDGLRVQE